MSSVNEVNKGTTKDNIAGYCRIGKSIANYSANIVSYLPANDGDKDDDAKDHRKLILPDNAG